ncbi:MAG: radical SAM family heme chaperone HemW [Clostridia bacterium]|nr:radical SAM family heme chaperone HemW [Clostridia bacterium]
MVSYSVMLKKGTEVMYGSASKKLGIYIHIPFCRTKCAYCDFYSFIPKGEEIYERYTNALMKHMEAYREAARDRVPDTVYIGGGTPTALPAEQLIRIIKAVKRNFKLSKNTEFTVEVNPKTCDYKTFVRLRRAGVNRISIGLQSADAGELKSLTRSHSRADFEECFKDARAAKIKNISVDLMFGIPNQTVRSLLSSIDYLTRLHPDHISLYDLKIEEGTPYFKIRDRLILPDEDTEFEMYTRAIEMLERRGYRQYEISNFARPGKMSRHNLKYWNCEEYLGFGPGAYSYFNSTRFSFARNLEAYIRGVEDPQSRINMSEGVEQITGKAQLGEYIMLGLRLNDGISMSEIARRYGVDFGVLYGKKAEKYINYGYMVKRGDRLFLTPQGMFISNYILSDLLSFEDLGALSPANNF